MNMISSGLKKIPIILTTISITVLFSAVAQGQVDTPPDTVKYVNPNPDLYKDEFIICRPAKVFINYKIASNEMVSLRRNFTDQILQTCPGPKFYPASRIWGFNQDNKYYRSGNTFDKNYVFAERVVTGKLSLFYCRNVPNNIGEIELRGTDSDGEPYRNRMIIEDVNTKRYQNDFSYFLSPLMDSTQMILVNNSNIGDVAKKYLRDSRPAYQDAMQYTKKNRIWEKIIFVSGVTFYIVSFMDKSSGRYNPINYKNPFFYLSLASIGTYIYIRVKNKHRYLSPNNMIRIISKYNGQVVK